MFFARFNGILKDFQNNAPTVRAALSVLSISEVAAALAAAVANKVDTTDSRLSDARSPLSHSHTLATATTGGFESPLHFKRNEALVDAATSVGMMAMIAVPLGGASLTVPLLHPMPDVNYDVKYQLVGVSGVNISIGTKTVSNIPFNFTPTGLAVAAAGFIFVQAKSKVPTS